jgi:hypothetical protein
MRQIKNLLKICITFILLLPLGFSFAQEEHPEYELNKIKFLGNEHFSSSVLADIIISKETPSWVSKELYKLYYKLGRKPSLFDSLLGATVQAIYYCPKDQKETERHPLHTCGTETVQIRGWQWMNNDVVNFACSAMGAISALGLWILLE